ncbi:hypothetical protein J4711_14555 [Staphylococcus epidermidis]|nr:hypothetical protein [Staphylococcus epidermidis]
MIRGEIGGGRVQISGRMTTMEANDTSLLLRAGSLAAPMEIIEYTIRPKPGCGQHQAWRGFRGLGSGGDCGLYVRVLHAVWRVLTIALSVNVLLLLAILVHAASDADPARHCRHGAGAGRGH